MWLLLARQPCECRWSPPDAATPDKAAKGPVSWRASSYQLQNFSPMSRSSEDGSSLSLLCTPMLSIHVTMERPDAVLFPTSTRESVRYIGWLSSEIQNPSMPRLLRSACSTICRRYGRLLVHCARYRMKVYTYLADIARLPRSRYLFF